MTTRRNLDDVVGALLAMLLWGLGATFAWNYLAPLTGGPQVTWAQGVIAVCGLTILRNVLR